MCFNMAAINSFWVSSPHECPGMLWRTSRISRDNRMCRGQTSWVSGHWPVPDFRNLATLSRPALAGLRPAGIVGDFA